MKIGDTFPIDGRDGLQDGHTDPVWYALRTPPQKERAARAYLLAQGIHAFYPNEERKTKRHGKIRTRKVPIVSGYVFARFTGNPRWHVIRRRPFFSGVVTLLGMPYPISRTTIRRLKGLTVEAAEHRRELEERREAHRRALEPRKGEKAHFVTGPLSGWTVDVSELSGGMARVILPSGLEVDASVSSLARL